jgi:hypothetical protein
VNRWQQVDQQSHEIRGDESGSWSTREADNETSNQSPYENAVATSRATQEWSTCMLAV